MNELLIFALGSLAGSALASFCWAVFHTQKTTELADELVSTRETIRRNAYARGYEAAKTGQLKRS